MFGPRHRCPIRESVWCSDIIKLLCSEDGTPRHYEESSTNGTPSYGWYEGHGTPFGGAGTQTSISYRRTSPRAGLTPQASRE